MKFARHQTTCRKLKRNIDHSVPNEAFINKTPLKRKFDIFFLLAGVGILALFTTRYRMPFRLDDVLLMLWAKTHSAHDILDPINGQMINSFRPVFTLTAFLLTRLAGWEHPFWWHLTLDLTLLIGITFTGLTARYLIQRWYALEISIALYWLTFLPILNIFFWYSDLTFGLEIAFTASAWYFGLRGLYEAKLGFWLLAMGLGSMAVLSKEPAFILVHLVLFGSFLLELGNIRVAWDATSRSNRYIAIAGYAILLGITAWVALVSPTKANRFFPLHSPELRYFVRERIEYYSATYLSVTARILLFSPLVYAFLRSMLFHRIKVRKGMQVPLISILAIVLSLLLFQNILISVPIVAFIVVTLATLPGPERERVRRLLPFAACLVIAIGALLFTIQLVKTQLTEAALLTSILSSWAWCVWAEDIQQAILPFRMKKAFRWMGSLSLIVIAGMLLVGIWPRIVHEERLLREVRDVRQNANDAVQWSALNLPKGSVLAVTDYTLYGIAGHGALTGKDDETKLAEQPTFPGGFVFDALAVLGRSDFPRTYLTDSIMLPRILDGMRREPNSYILLQSKLDIDRFHGSAGRDPLLSAQDSMIARFSHGPYPTEVWMMRSTSPKAPDETLELN